MLPTDADSPDRFAGRQAALALPRALDLDVDPPLAGAGFAAGAIELTGPAVTDAPSETDPLPAAGNYVHWLSTVGWQAVRDDQPPAGGDTLLFALLRHSLLRTYATTAADLVAAQGDEPNESVWAALEAPLVEVTGARPLGQFLDDLRASGDFAASPMAASVAELGEVQAALVHLAGLPSAALQRLLAGTLDVCSHRLDAWVTAHATHTLDELRRQRSTGLQLGGYGVLHDVRPSPVRALGEQIAQLRATLAAAQARAAAAAPASAQVATELAAAQAQAAASEGDLASLDAQVDRTEQQLQSLLDALGEDNRLVGLVQRLPIDGDGGGGGRPDPALQRRIHETEQRLSALRAALPPAQTKAAADGRNAAAVAVRMAAAESELRAAEAEVARLTSQLGEAEAAERDARDVAANKGYIHAPSLGQAATAAVLRSGHLAHKRDADSPFEIDLSSRRVRLALKLLDGIRQGQPLGACSATASSGASTRAIPAWRWTSTSPRSGPWRRSTTPPRPRPSSAPRCPARPIWPPGWVGSSCSWGPTATPTRRPRTLCARRSPAPKPTWTPLRPARPRSPTNCSWPRTRCSCSSTASTSSTCPHTSRRGSCTTGTSRTRGSRRRCWPGSTPSRSRSRA